jgi:hypothetical protein
MSQPATKSTKWSILTSGKSSLGQHLFISVKSMHIRHFPFFLLTITMLANHFGYVTSLMNHVSNSHCTSAFAASTLSSDILRSFYFLCFAFGWIFNMCSINSLLTPIKSEVDQVNTSLFLSRSCRSSACSSRLILAPMQTILSSTLGSSATLVKLPLASIAFLNFAEVSCLDGGYTESC